MEFLAEYGLFLAKVVTIVVAIIVIISVIVASSMRNGGKSGASTGRGKIVVKSLSEYYESLKDSMRQQVLSPSNYNAEKKLADKAKKQIEKKQKKDKQYQHKKRVYVIDFVGDVKASAVENLREEVTAILTTAKPGDEVVVKVESMGGMVHTYGLATSQLQRIKDQNIDLTICVDKVAASGGYMMACLGDKLLAAPFAIIGSIGVLAQIPNFHRLLKKYDVDYDILTAGEYKQSMTMFGENTDKMKEKLNDDLHDTHILFKEHVSSHRPELDIDKVATGEIWYGQRALDEKLVDVLQTSDSYLQELAEVTDIFSVQYKVKQSLQDRIGLSAQRIMDAVIDTVIKRNNDDRMSRF